MYDPHQTTICSIDYVQYMCLMICDLITGVYEKIICRREATQCFVP